MADEILDLDLFVPPARMIMINKKKYRVTGGGTVGATLELIEASKAFQNDSQSAEHLTALLTAMQQFFIDDISIEELKKIDLTRQMPKLLAFLYGNDLKDLQEPEPEKKSEEPGSQKNPAE